MEEEDLKTMMENLRKCVRDFAEQIQLLRNEMSTLTTILANTAAMKGAWPSAEGVTHRRKK